MRLKLYDHSGDVITIINVDTDEYLNACDHGHWLSDEAPEIADFDVLDDPYLEGILSDMAA